ncbi:MAG: hypothetical protein ACRDN6_07895 [Gaiellaceae bacterium]
MLTTTEREEGRGETLPVSFVPQPTQAYASHLARKALNTKAGPIPGAAAGPTVPAPIPPVGLSRGARVLMWKQDPSVKEIGIRKAFLPKRVYTGPKDARISIQGLTPVGPNVFGDLIVDPAVDAEAFDCVHTFAIIRQVLTMYERFRWPKPVPWQWNTGGNTDPLACHPRAGVTQNAYYSRTQKALKFFYFDSTTPPPLHTVYTCRSFDIVAHETGHAILDGLKPGWLTAGNPPQTGGLHESFGDLTAIFLTLSQMDQVEAIVAQTKADLHAKSFLADMAEEFGLALGRPNGLRNADNDLKLSQVSNEVHAISQVFTGGVFDVLADIFTFQRKPAKRDDAFVLYESAQYVCGLVFRALAAAPNIGATYADVVNKMLALVTADGKPVQYKNAIVNRFTLREVLAPFAVELAAHEDVEVAPAFTDSPDSIQNRAGCCGTMQRAEYMGEEETLDAQVRELKAAFATNGAEPRRRRATKSTKS